jgi:sulfur-oxidizing protein SoxX
MSAQTGGTRHSLVRRRLVAAALAHASALAMADAAVAADSPPTAAVSLHVVDDGIPEPLAASTGDAARGLRLLVARDPANCVLCHAIPDAAVRFAGDVGPSLAGVGARLTIPQLRLRVADNLRVQPATIMPSYYRVDGLARVASAYRGKPILSATEVEDVVAYLATLR